MSNIDEIPICLYEGSVEYRHFLSKDEALRYVTAFFNREADKIDQKYNDSNDEDYNPSHQNNVDTLLENTPTMTKVMNERMREVLVYTIKHAETAERKYKKDIDNSDILLKDDSIRAGQTVQEAINVINGLYNPKSVTVLTLLSSC